MSYSGEDLAVVNTGPDSLSLYEPISSLTDEDESYPNGLESINFVVKTFGSNDSNSPGGTSFVDSDEIQLSDEFEDSYLSLVNDKMNRLEGGMIEKTPDGKEDSSRKDSSDAGGIFGDVWIAEFDAPVDLAMFKKILINSLYNMRRDTERFDTADSCRPSTQDVSEGENFRENVDSVSTPQKSSEKSSVPGESSPIAILSSEKNTDVSKSSDNDVVFIIGKPKRRGRPRRKRRRLFFRKRASKSRISGESGDEIESEHEAVEAEEQESPKREYHFRTRTKPLTNSDGTLYFKTERFSDLLVNCPFFSSHKVVNVELASKKAALIIERLTKEAEDSNDLPSNDNPEAPEPVEVTETTGNASETLDTSYDPDKKSNVVKGASKRKTKRRYSTRPRHLRRSSKHSRRQAFLQKLSTLVDRISSKFINIKKDEIACDKFYKTIKDATEYVTGTYGWKHDPYYFNSQGTMENYILAKLTKYLKINYLSYCPMNSVKSTATTRGHGLYLTCGGSSVPRDLETSLKHPFLIPEISNDRISHREIVKRMLQDY